VRAKAEREDLEAPLANADALGYLQARKASAAQARAVILIVAQKK